MEGLLEGINRIGEVEFPKQICSFPAKNDMGAYIKQRIWVPLSQPVQRHHLDSYGRTNISVSLLINGIYSCDFSV